LFDFDLIINRVSVVFNVMHVLSPSGNNNNNQLLVLYG